MIIDSGLNTGGMSYDEAVELETETIGFVPEGGRINIDNITARTGADYAAPTLGYFQWMLLREDYFQKMRELNERGTLKDLPRSRVPDRVPTRRAGSRSPVP